MLIQTTANFEEDNLREEVQFEFEDGSALSIFVYIQKVMGEPDALRGALSLDFGTTNSCYAGSAELVKKCRCQTLFNRQSLRVKSLL